VVSPLVSLSTDQLLYLSSVGIDARTIAATTPRAEAKETQAAMLDPDSTLKLLYCTPEKIMKSKMFMAKLAKAYDLKRLARITIDESHCCSQVFFRSLCAALLCPSDITLLVCSLDTTSGPIMHRSAF
jgi:ATP-dependent DNA helicase Q1